MQNVINRLKDEMKVCKQAKQFLAENTVKNNYNNEKEKTVTPKITSKLFESYDEFAFINKTKIDSLYFNKLLNNVEEELTESAEKVVNKLFDTMDSIYQFTNIKPSIYGKGITHSILNESIDKSNKIVTSIIADCIQRNYYSLSNEERKIKYQDKVITETKEFVQYDIEIDKATELALKKCVMENVITSICFPPLVWSRINTMSSCEKFNKIFEVEELTSLLDTFKQDVSNLSAIIASTI